jgi:hypothetical protein
MLTPQRCRRSSDEAAAKPRKYADLSRPSQDALELLHVYASEGLDPSRAEEVGSAIAQLQCETFIAAELIAELKKAGDPSWKTWCSNAMD